MGKIKLLSVLCLIACTPEESKLKSFVSLSEFTQTHKNVTQMNFASADADRFSCSYVSYGLQYCDDYEGLSDASVSWAVQECQGLGGALMPASRCTSDNRQSECVQTIEFETLVKVTSVFYKLDSSPTLVMECASKLKSDSASH